MSDTRERCDTGAIGWGDQGSSGAAQHEEDASSAPVLVWKKSLRENGDMRSLRPSYVIWYCPGAVRPCTYWSISNDAEISTLSRFRLATLVYIAVILGQQPTPAPPGILIDLGGRRLHLNCTGTGTPTAIV